MLYEHTRVWVCAFLSFFGGSVLDVLPSVHIVFLHPRRQPRLLSSLFSSDDFPHLAVHGWTVFPTSITHLGYRLCPCQVYQGGHVPLPFHKDRVRGEQEGTGVDARGDRQLLGDDQQERSCRSHWPKQLA